MREPRFFHSRALLKVVRGRKTRGSVLQTLLRVTRGR